MTPLARLLAIAVLTAGCTATPSGYVIADIPDEPLTGWRVTPNTVAYGDSITAGGADPNPWPGYLDGVTNRGENGAGFMVRGQRGHTIVENVLDDAAACGCVPATVVLTGSVNDAYYVPGEIEQVVDNIRLLDAWLRLAGSDPVWVTPPFVGLGTSGGVDTVPEVETKNEFLGTVADTMRELGGRDVGVVLGHPLAAAFHIGDGVHLNDTGDALFAATVGNPG